MTYIDSWMTYIGSGMIYIVFLTVHNPDQPEPKRLLFTAEHTENAKMFFIIKFFSAISALSAVKKNILPERGKISR